MSDFPRHYVEQAQNTTELQFERIQALRLDYYMTYLAAIGDKQIAEFVDRTQLETWRDPNLSVGNWLVRSGQSFSDPKVAYIEDSKELLATAYSATNVSSGNNGVLGMFELLAKLHLPLLKGSRYRSIREIVGYTQEDIKKTMLLSLMDYEQQPVTVYPFDTETMVCDVLENAGFIQDQLFHEPAFEKRATQVGVHMLKFCAPNAGLVIERSEQLGA